MTTAKTAPILSPSAHGTVDPPFPVRGATTCSTQLIPRIVGALKRFSNRDAGFDLRQTSFYDHIIRSESDFLSVWNDISTNPIRWSEDIYYDADF